MTANLDLCVRGSSSFSFRWKENSSFVFLLHPIMRCLLFFVIVLILLTGYVEGSRQVGEKAGCISAKEMGLESKLKRYIIDDVRQVTMPLSLESTTRVSHRLTNAIFRLFIQEVVGYQDVQLQYIEEPVTPERSLGFPVESDETTNANVNLEVWIPPGFSDEKRINIDNLGSQGTGGRYGWYVQESSMQKSGLITDHWRSFQKEKVARIFSVTDRQLKEIKEIYTRSADGTHFCPDDVCEEGIFVPSICKAVLRCAMLFAGHYKYSSFLVEQVVEQHLLVQVAWIGANLTPEFVERFRGGESTVFFTRWPSPMSVLSDTVRVAFPSCTELDKRRANDYLCKYELHTLRKHTSEKLGDIGALAYETVGRFSLHERDYRTLLLEYNRRVAFNESESLIRTSRVMGWDDDIINAIACDWLNKTSVTSPMKMRLWMPSDYDVKPTLWFAGIFPLTDGSGKYTSKTLLHAAQMAVFDINHNISILDDYSLKLNAENGGCESDESLYSYIKYIRTADMNYDQMIGILGPSCSDTVEPLAGIAKLLKTVIVSYSAEGAIFNDQGKYPYFFRTIPANKLYRYVYLQIFKELKWKRLASLTEDGNKYSEYLTLLQDILQAENITIFNRKFPREARKDMATYLKFLKDENYRIIIGDFYSGMACEIMCEAYKLEMTARQGFIWFLPRWFGSKWYDTDNNKYNEDKVSCSTHDMLDALDGHLSLGYAYYASDDVVYHSGKTVGEWKRRYSVMHNNSQPADYAGYTYDAVWTYAFALDKLLRENLTHAANLHSNMTNERFVQLLRKTDFLGVSGHINFGDGPSRKTIVNIMQFRSNFRTIDGIYNIVGKFSPNSTMDRGGIISLNSSAIEWLTPDGEQPGDGSPPETVCALAAFSRLLGLNCEVTIVITMLISFLVFAILVIVLFIIYKTKYEKIEPPHWALDHLMNLGEWEIPRERIVINRTIGTGAFGTVYGGECLASEDGTWDAVAVKTLKVGSTSENKLDFLGEADMMRQFDHDNVVRLIGVSTREEPIFMIMEFMLYGDLKTYLLARRHLVSERTHFDDDNEVSSRRLTLMALNVASALEYLARNKYVHRDVACRNCLVNADRVVKLSDFGMTRPVCETNYYRFNRKGLLPVRWMAPESIEDGIYTTKSDAWSFGVLLYEIITFGNFPFQGMSNNQVLEHVVKHGNTLELPAGVKSSLEYMIKRCWLRIPEARPEFIEMIDLFSTMTRIVVPCLEVPLASVQTNDSDSVDIGIDASRRPWPHQKPSVTAVISDNIPSSNRLSSDPLSPSVISGNSIALPPFPRRTRTPYENGSGPAVEPLLPLTGDSYITRYACLQMNKSPDSSETVSPGVTSV